MKWIRKNLKIVAPVGVVLAVIVGYLAFGVFGIQTLFFDDKVNEAGPVFASGANASGLDSDAVDDATTDEMNDFMEEEGTPLEVEVSEPMPDPETDETVDPETGDTETSETAESVAPAAEPAAPEIVTLVEGNFVPRSHPASGLAKVLNDGTEQRFLRFEDFETDNGPDLNVYLTTADADADAGAFGESGQFVDLGNLKGNVGPQNYEIPPDVDLSQFDTVVIWCVRFGVAFGAADLA